MSGMITKRHFFLVLVTFGLSKALRLLVAREKTALEILLGR